MRRLVTPLGIISGLLLFVLQLVRGSDPIYAVGTALALIGAVALVALIGCAVLLRAGVRARKVRPHRPVTS